MRVPRETFLGEIMVAAQGGEDAAGRRMGCESLRHGRGHLGEKGGLQEKFLHLFPRPVKNFSGEIVENFFRDEFPAGFGSQPSKFSLSMRKTNPAAQPSTSRWIRRTVSRDSLFGARRRTIPRIHPGSYGVGSIQEPPSGG